LPRSLRFALKLSLILVVITSRGLSCVAQGPLRLTFDKSAADWNHALPIGNGRVGAMVFGGIEDARIQVNEDTLWGGGPHDYTNPDAYSHLQEIRGLIFAGKIAEAEKVSADVMGKPKLLMPFQPFCDIHLHFPGHNAPTDYHRDLNLNDALAESVYTVNGVTFRREVFASFPDQVLVVRLTASQPGQLTFAVQMDSPQPGTTVESTADDTLQLTGQIQPRQNRPYSWTGSWNKPGMRFAGLLQVVPEGGTVHANGQSLEVSAADSVTLLFSPATDFRNYRDISGDALAAAHAYLTRASAHSYAALLKRHLDDYRSLFSRVQLSLGPDRSTDSIDQRIKDFATTDDPSLLALYFAFGRYLLISSSRQGGQPANLQGIWNQDLTPPWASKWTTNINLEMNYWQADAGDLWETEQPLWNLIRDLEVTGAETARVQYHANGWVLHHNTDLWRATTPVDGPWGLWPMGSLWLANQMWDHYTFSLDRAFLRKDAYPAMKGAAEFALSFLVEAPPGTPFAGRLVTNPSTSPENAYLLNGKRASLTYAATMDLELIRELFENCRRAARVLGVDPAFSAKLDTTLKRLPPLQIGKQGQLQEWIEDYLETEPHHRHVSHLYSLYPGHDIALDTTPGFAAAAEKTLVIRGDGGTGWSEVWRAALWARLRNPEHAYNNLKLLITQNTLPNMFDLCPPFQIDGNLGGPAAITEMLIQSTDGEIRILPALPQQWPTGSLTGVRVRGGARVSLAWDKGRLTSVTLESARAIHYRVDYGEQSGDFRLAPNKLVSLDGELRPITKQRKG
jgi:alpha-L-fucosidase 2